MMKNIYLFPILIALMCIYSCNKNPINEETIAPEGSPINININFSDELIKTRASGLNQTEEKKINSLHILVFNSAGVLVSKHYFPSGSFNITSPIRIPTFSGNNMSVYVVANLSPLSLNGAAVSTYFDNITTISKLSEKIVYAANEDAHTNRLMTMTGVKSGLSIQSSLKSISIPLNYIASRVKFYAISKPIAGEVFSLTSWNSANSPIFSYIVSGTNDAVNPNIAANYEIKGIESTWRDTTILLSGVATAAKYTVVYFFENRRGGRLTGSPTDTDQRLKAKYAPNYATALELNGLHTKNGIKANVKCKIYLGANSYNDYNLIRSNDYTVTAVFKGINDISIDTRITASKYGYTAVIGGSIFDAHYDFRTMLITSYAGDAKVEILQSNGSVAPANFWLKASKTNIYKHILIDGAYKRLVFDPATTLTTVVSNISFTDPLNLTSKYIYLYSDNYNSALGQRTAKVRISNSQDIAGITTPITLDVTQKGYISMGLVGLRKRGTDGLTLGTVGYQVVMEQIDEGALDMSPIFLGSNGTTQWGFYNGQAQPTTSINKGFYERNGWDNTKSMSVDALGNTTASYDRLSPTIVSESVIDHQHNVHAARYCFEKNRDLNGDGKITDNEISWYLPSSDEWILFYLGNKIIAPMGLFDNTKIYYTSTELFVGYSLTYNPSTINTSGIILPNLKTSLQKVRCVRRIDPISVSPLAEYASNVFKINNSGFSAAARRTTLLSIPVPYHYENSDINQKLPNKLIVAKRNAKSRGTVGFATMSWQEAMGYSAINGTGAPAISGCHNYYEAGVIEIGKWRAPTLKEFYLIALSDYDLLYSNPGYTSIFDTDLSIYWTATTVVGNDARAFIFETSSRNINTALKATQKYNTRCVRGEL